MLALMMQYFAEKHLLQPFEMSEFSLIWTDLNWLSLLEGRVLHKRKWVAACISVQNYKNIHYGLTFCLLIIMI